MCTILNQTVRKPYPYTEFDGTHIKGERQDGTAAELRPDRYHNVPAAEI